MRIDEEDAHVSAAAPTAATGQLKIAGIRTLRCELWSADDLSVRPSVRPSVLAIPEEILSANDRDRTAISCTVPKRTRNSSSAGHTATFLVFSWTIATRTARFHFILSSTVRETTTTRRTARTLPSSLFTNFGCECRE